MSSISDHTKYNDYMRKYTTYTYTVKKIRAIEYKGNICIKCGYSKCPAAMTFHHRDSNEKEFDWKSLRKRPWNIIVQELDKCDLLCCRCHTELHYDPTPLHVAQEWLMNHKKPTTKYEKYGICKQCGITFERDHCSSHTIYCSKKCAHKSQERADYPPDEDFIKLIDKIGRVKASSMFNVSHRAIARRYNKIKFGAFGGIRTHKMAD